MLEEIDIATDETTAAEESSLAANVQSNQTEFISQGTKTRTYI